MATHPVLTSPGLAQGAGARRLLRTAVLATPVVAVTGLADARRLDARRRRVAVVHVACNLVASTLGVAPLARTSPGEHPGRVLGRLVSAQDDDDD